MFDILVTLILPFFLLWEQGSPYFHFAKGFTNYVADPAEILGFY